MTLRDRLKAGFTRVRGGHAERESAQVRGQDPRHNFGEQAESMAEQYLRRKGYRIVAKNLRFSNGEIDLVVDSGKWLVFVEVKGRRGAGYGGGAGAVHDKKQAKLIRLAAQYIANRGLRGPLCRFDVVLCRGDKGQGAVLEHIEHAFEVPGEDLRW